MAVLEDLEVLEISIVEEPANERDILFFKSKGENSMPNELEESKFEKTETFQEILEKNDFDRQQEVKLRVSLRALESLQKDVSEDNYEKIASQIFGEAINEGDDVSAQELAEDIMGRVGELKGKEDNDDKKNEALKEKVSDLINKVNENKENLESDTLSDLSENLNELAEEVGSEEKVESGSDTPDLGDVPEEIEGKLDELWKQKEKQIEKERKEREELKKELEKHKSERELKKEIEKANNKYSYLKGSPEDLGDLMKEIKEHDEGLYGRVEKQLEAANKQVEESGFYEEVGKSGSDNDSAAEELEHAARKIMEDKDISFEKAYAKAMKRNPELYKQYKKEKK